jgi:exopolyphosphatase / guanosine-5'-triphosphate,3'-diphosphate pyrophosphatase
LKEALVIGENPQLVGTSGTIESLVRVVTCEALGTCPTSLHGYVLTLEDLEALVVRLRKATYAERVSIPGMSERRAEIILAGAVILRQVMRSLGMKTIKTCERSLREGIVVDWMLNQGLIEDRLRYQASVRERTVLNLAQRFHVNLDSALQVAQFALTMFDQTQGLLHYWGARQRELLWAAAVLHNAGHYISHASHHKHSYYLIRNGGLLGYTDAEIELIANIARYHRKGPPKKKHDAYRNLMKQDRVVVDQLSAILKLAAALDRRQQGAIAQVELLYHGASKSVVMHLETSDSQGDCGLELWSLNFKKVCFEQAFNVTLSIKVHARVGVSS